MSFPSYLEYKDSGVEWLGAVPEHWVITKTKYVCSFLTGWTPPTGNASAYEGENLWANISDLGPKFLEDTAKRISDEAIATSGIPCSPKGSLLFSFKLSIGQVSFAGQDMFTNEAIATFQESPSLDMAYAYYAFPLFLVKNASENIYGAKLLNQELIRAANLVLPPLNEQRYIANFLEYELAKIDGLVAEQNKLIALLKEKRQAVISYAVTRGVDPEVTLKDSGVEWMGKVPQHWEVAHLKHFCLEITDGAHISPDTEGGVYYFVSTKDLSGETIDFDGALLTSESSYDYLLKTGCRPFPGDVLFSKDGTIGRTIVVRDDREFVVASSLIIIRPDTSVLDADYLNFLCKSFLVAAQVESFVKGAGLPRLSIQNLLKVLGVFPPKGEQEEIAEFLLGRQAQFDALIKEAESAIDLLKERRTALISAVVTGQIDVRGLVTKEEEKAA